MTPINEAGKAGESGDCGREVLARRRRQHDLTGSRAGQTDDRALAVEYALRGEVTAVVNPALRAASMRLWERLTRSAASAQRWLDGGPPGRAAGSSKQAKQRGAGEPAAKL